MSTRTARATRQAAAWVLLAAAATAQSPTAKDDPLVRMPGTQPSPEGSVALEAPNRCLNCHSGYNPAVEPGHNWKGSMMAQSARDPLFYACLTVAAQDSIWALGTPNAGDLCMRCHFPKGWLEGRSDPPNAAAMSGADFDGVQCDFCHSAYDPFYENTHSGFREVGDWVSYWDETDQSSTPSTPAAQTTRDVDQQEAATVRLFTGGLRTDRFFVGDQPPLRYTENGSGQYFVDGSRAKRSSFADADARHQMLYSRYHKSRYFCSTCHDVSNPVLQNLGRTGEHPLPSEREAAFSYYHVERTFSEFMLSAYGQDGGAPGIGPFAPGAFTTSLANDNIARCQDCHMRDGVGAGSNKAGSPIRPNQSIEHPMSGVPIHDMTGGNAWVLTLLASAARGSPNHDPVNEALLGQGPAALTLDLSAGEGLDPDALLAGADRAVQQLASAAALEDLTYSPSSGALSFRIQNQTGHRLISGFPEGRRMFVNVKVFDGSTLLAEINPYDDAAGTLKGLSYAYQPDPNGALPLPGSLDPTTERYVDELVYEVHPSSALTGEVKTFHFVLADERYKDNRIPPKGFRIADAAARLCVPRWHGQAAPGYFTADEYAGGYDAVLLQVPPGGTHVEVDLYYQVTSREYIEFLRDEINGNPQQQTLPAGGYVAQSDPFFDALRAWGDTIWSLWSHNKDVAGAAPIRIAQATFGAPPPSCTAPAPTLLSATPGSGEVTLAWSDEHSGDPDVVGYRVSYYQANKAHFLADVGLVTSYVDRGLTNGQSYCYTVQSRHASCESALSNTLCATPNATGQLRVGVDRIATGAWVETGRGNNRTVTFELRATFTAGEEIELRALVLEAATGLPVQNAAVDLLLTGPSTLTLTSAPSDANGEAAAAWSTQAPNKRGQGGTPTGTYTMTVTAVTAAGYTWDDVPTAVQIVLN